MSCLPDTKGVSGLPNNGITDTDSTYREEAQLIDEQLRRERRQWFKRHMTVIYIVIGIVVAVAVFFGIKWYNDGRSPISRFVSASGKDLGTSFTFHLTAQKNGESVMTYSGTAAFRPSAQGISVVYDADYNSYSYRAVLDTVGSKTTKGNYYNGQWIVSDCTAQVHEFYDFYHDYQNGSFDGGSFLRFTGMNSYLNAQELNRFMDTVKSRLSSDSAIAKITADDSENGTAYRYEINVKELFDLIRTKGAPMFYTSTDYDRFVARLDANTANIARAKCSVAFTINKSGYMSELHIAVDTGENTYSLSLAMDDFGSAVPEIPEDFYSAAGLGSDNG